MNLCTIWGVVWDGLSALPCSHQGQWLCVSCQSDSPPHGLLASLGMQGGGPHMVLEGCPVQYCHCPVVARVVSPSVLEPSAVVAWESWALRSVARSGGFGLMLTEGHLNVV